MYHLVDINSATILSSHATVDAALPAVAKLTCFAVLSNRTEDEIAEILEQAEHECWQPKKTANTLSY